MLGANLCIRNRSESSAPIRKFRAAENPGLEGWPAHGERSVKTNPPVLSKTIPATQETQAMRLISSLLALAMTVAFAGAASTQQVAATGEPVLEVSGAISKKNQGDKMVFDFAALQRLPQATIVTSTPWNTAVTKFEGVSGKAFIEAIGAKGKMIKARAINDYTIEMPVEDFLTKGLILAMKANGQPLSLRDRGPLWIIYPWDSNAELRDKQHQRRSIWQLVSITVVE
jgi:hypothetical protein